MIKMGQVSTKRFGIKLRFENNYYRVHITHPDFKGRIRKRLGEKNYEDAENKAANIRYEITKQFENQEVTMKAAEDFVENYIALNIKKTASIFDYKEEFIKKKISTKNKHTKNPLANSTVSGYRTAIQYFEDYFKKKEYRNTLHT